MQRSASPATSYVNSAVLFVTNPVLDVPIRSSPVYVEPAFVTIGSARATV
jgi:hypothetical protein